MKKIILTSVFALIFIITFAQTRNYYNYVDLGLSSGTKWATCNVGAKNPWEYGDYFAWGETKSKSIYSSAMYKYSCNGKYDVVTKYCIHPKTGCNNLTDNLTVLQPSDDAATVNMGNGWHIPTLTQWEELINNCNWVWTSSFREKGVAGFLVYSKKYPERYIFLPAAGEAVEDVHYHIGEWCSYWSSSLFSKSSAFAHILHCIYNRVKTFEYYRYFGYSVRAVTK